MTSPLFQGAIEDFEHAVEHFKSGNTIDNKYAIVNAANSVELILKEKLRSMDIRVFQSKPPYNSLGFYECLRVLENNDVKIPMEADIELLHQERNICVHLANKPDKDKTKWLMDMTKRFMRQFCMNNLNMDKDELPKVLRVEERIRVKLQAPATPIDIWLNEAQKAYKANNPALCVTNAYTAINMAIRERFGPFTSHVEMVKHIRKRKLLPPGILAQVEQIRMIRNSAVHEGVIPTAKDALLAIELAGKVTEALRNKTWP